MKHYMNIETGELTPYNKTAQEWYAEGVDVDILELTPDGWNVLGRWAH